MIGTRTPLPALLAMIALGIHLPILTRYGIHHDELYFIACGRHLALGYVDHAPLIPWIACLMDTLFPLSLFALRLPAALAGAATVFLIGLLAREPGGGQLAQLAACLATLAAPVYLRTSHFLNIPSIEIPLWALVAFLLARLLRTDDARLWAAIGLACGLGLLTKHSVLFLGFGLVTGLVLTPSRRYFRSAWLYLGGSLALLLFLPNVAWQHAHGWPTVEFLRQLNAGTMQRISAAQFTLGQVLYLNPASAPLWLAGLGYLLFSRESRPFRALGWIYVSVFVLLLLMKSKIYYLAPAYASLFAAGGVALERAVANGRPWLRSMALAMLIIGGAALLPISLPIFSIDTTERYVSAATLGTLENVYELTGDLRGMFGWEERARAVARVYYTLSADERGRTMIYGSWYGVAGAIDYFGPALGLPPAYSGHMSYHLWGPPAGRIDTVILAHANPEELRTIFDEVEVAADVELAHVNPWERRFKVAVCRKPKLGVLELWPRLRRWS